MILIKKLKEKIPVQKAGGGLVYYAKGDVLFIFRNGKWDLPKGGKDKFEKLAKTAVREVEEETGVNELTVEEKLSKTYHVFKRNGRFKLKITQWYRMNSTFAGELIGQAEEGIDQVAWLNPDQVKEALTNSYENIKLLFED